MCFFKVYFNVLMNFSVSTYYCSNDSDCDQGHEGWGSRRVSSPSRYVFLFFSLVFCLLIFLSHNLGTTATTWTTATMTGIRDQGYEGWDSRRVSSPIRYVFYFILVFFYANCFVLL